MSFSASPPFIAAEIDFETLRQQRLESFAEAWEAFRAEYPSSNLPAYDTATLQSETSVIALRAAAYGDLHFRELLNDVARATLLARFSRLADLDLQGLATVTPATPEGLLRHPGESDESYLARILAARAGASAAGPDEWWLTHIRAAHPGATGATLSYHGLGRLTVAVTIAAGADPDEVLAAVRARLALGWVKPQGVTVTVEAAP